MCQGEAESIITTFSKSFKYSTFVQICHLYNPYAIQHLAADRNDSVEA